MTGCITTHHSPLTSHPTAPAIIAKAHQSAPISNKHHQSPSAPTLSPVFRWGKSTPPRSSQRAGSSPMFHHHHSCLRGSHHHHHTRQTSLSACLDRSRLECSHWSPASSSTPFKGPRPPGGFVSSPLGLGTTLVGPLETVNKIIIHIITRASDRHR